MMPPELTGHRAHPLLNSASSAAVGSTISRDIILPSRVMGPLSKIRSRNDRTNARNFSSGRASAATPSNGGYFSNAFRCE